MKVYLERRRLHHVCFLSPLRPTSLTHYYQVCFLFIQSLAVDRHTNDVKQMDRQVGGTWCIILCPIRELASQTLLVAEKLTLNSFRWLVPGCLSGGEKRKSEKARIRKGISILIATPGRLLDHLSRTDSLLVALKGKLEWRVLDEAVPRPAANDNKLKGRECTCGYDGYKRNDTEMEVDTWVALYGRRQHIMDGL